MDQEPSLSSSHATVVGIDLGTLSSKVTLGSRFDFELVRNSHGGHTTPSCVTILTNRARLLGEDATEIERGDASSVWGIDRLLPGSLATSSGDSSDPLAPFCRFRRSGDGQTVAIPDAGREYCATSLLAMLLGRIKRNVDATLDRLASAYKAAGLRFVFAVPPSYPPVARQALLDAAFAASVPCAATVSSTDCISAVYHRKFAESATEAPKAVLVVEMGHARTNVSLLHLGRADSDMEVEPPPQPDQSAPSGDAMDVDGANEEKKDSADEEPLLNAEQTQQQPNIKTLSTFSSPTLGAGLVDLALYHHFLSTHPSLISRNNSDGIQPNSRPGQRLLAGCRKLKHLLSMLPEGAVTVETIGNNDTDVTLTMTRSTMTELCQPVIQTLKTLIQSTIDKAAIPLDKISSVELTGGGSRIPMVQDAIRDILQKDADFSFSKSLDDTSLAFGAALLASSPLSCEITDNDETQMTPERILRRKELLETEQSLANQDAQIRKKDEMRNQIESHILELKSAKHSNYSHLLPNNDDEFETHLNSTDDWLFSEECDNATLSQMEQKWKDVQAKTNQLCKDYLSAKKEDAEKKEQEMEQEAQQALAEKELEQAMNPDNDDDHDTRKLPTKRRMEMVLKNKKEANELFSDKNYRHAAARYSKALTHCTKFFDLSPEETKEVKEVKLTLHLNTALCHIKLKKYENALQSCNEALIIDSQNVKALYRRATVHYERKRFDDCFTDLKEAEKHMTGEDKAVLKLKRMVEQQRMKMKAKEKAMAKKMFG